MKKIKVVILSILPLMFLVAGCSDKSKEEAQTPPPAPPIDTMLAIDTTPAMPIETVPAEPELPGMPPAPQGDGYAVQVASCTDEAYARYLVDLWTGRGYEPFVSNFSYEGTNHYRVRLGLFMTHAEAKAMTAELLDKYSLKTWVDQVSY